MIQNKQKIQLVAHAPLDKLAQLRKNPLDRLQKRARSKFIQGELINSLRSLKSDLNDSYRNTAFCSSKLYQNGKEFIAHFCGNRWCLICNRIRTAKLINGYLQPLNDLQDLQFVTLTVKNVKGENLKFTIQTMFKELKNIQEVMRKRKLMLTGLKKIECTYNQKRNDFHPHFHCVISGLLQSKMLLKEWLKRFPDSLEICQDIRKADENSIKELFKYFTKLLSKDEKSFSPYNLNIMFIAMKGIRVFQPIGKLKKLQVSEEVDSLQVVEYEKAKPAFHVFHEWDKFDWVNKDTGEVLTNYNPNESTIKLQESIKS